METKKIKDFFYKLFGRKTQKKEVWDILEEDVNLMLRCDCGTMWGKDMIDKECLICKKILKKEYYRTRGIVRPKL